jgi:hypothetical protein
MIEEERLPDFSGKVVVLYIGAAPAAIQNGRRAGIC